MKASFLFVAIALPASVPSPAAERTIGVVPLTEARPEAYSARQSQSFGVFAGVEAFEDPSFSPLQFASADAR